MKLTDDEQMECRRKAKKIIEQCSNKIRALCYSIDHASWVSLSIKDLEFPKNRDSPNPLKELDELYTKHIENSKWSL